MKQADTQEIEKILSEVEALSLQTRLLALNASIEAARAGEAGKDFASMADAVTALSKRTGSFSAQIYERFNAMTQAVASAVAQAGAFIQQWGTRDLDLIGESQSVDGEAGLLLPFQDFVGQLTAQIAQRTEAMAAMVEQIGKLVKESGDNSLDALIDELRSAAERALKLSTSRPIVQSEGAEVDSF
jgi:methyl-accepting chemotaxis protein